MTIAGMSSPHERDFSLMKVSFWLRMSAWEVGTKPTCRAEREVLEGRGEEVEDGVPVEHYGGGGEKRARRKWRLEAIASSSASPQAASVLPSPALLGKYTMNRVSSSGGAFSSAAVCCRKEKRSRIILSGTFVWLWW